MARSSMLPDITDVWSDADKARYLQECEDAGCDPRTSADATGIHCKTFSAAARKLTGEARAAFFRKYSGMSTYESPKKVDLIEAILAGDVRSEGYLYVGGSYMCESTWKIAIHERVATGSLSLLQTRAIPSIYAIRKAYWYGDNDTEIPCTKDELIATTRRILDRAALARRRLEDLEIDDMALELAADAQSIEDFESAAIHVHFIVRGRFGRSSPFRAFPDAVVMACHAAVPGSARFVRAIGTERKAKELSSIKLEPIEVAMERAGTCPTVDLVDALSAYVQETRPGKHVVAVPGRKEFLHGRMRYVDCELKMVDVVPPKQAPVPRGRRSRQRWFDDSDTE